MVEKLEDFKHWLGHDIQLAAKSVADYEKVTRQWMSSGLSGMNFILDPTVTPATKRVRGAALTRWHEFIDEPFTPPHIRGGSPLTPVFADRPVVEAMLLHLRDNFDYSSYMAAALMYRGGLRPAECCDLKVADVDLTLRMMTVTGKGGKTRNVPLRQELIDSLKRWIGFVRPRRIAVTAEHGYLLCGTRGGRLLEDGRWRTDILGSYKASGLGRPHCKPIHWLRHMFASHAVLYSGATPAELAYIMGHKNIQTTYLYIHTASVQTLKKKMEQADADYRSETGHRAEDTGELVTHASADTGCNDRTIQFPTARSS